MSVSVIVSDVLSEDIKKLLEEVERETVKACASKYGFSESDVLKELGLIIGKKVPLPFTGLVNDCCKGLRQNHGLLTQCMKSRIEGVDYCKGCKKQCDKNASGKPDSGCIEDRLAAYNSGKEYRDPKGRAPVCYAKVMHKLKLTKEDVRCEAAKYSISLGDEYFQNTTVKRGRPKKEPSSSSDTDNDVPKKRGRPKKVEKPVELTST